MSTIKLRRGAAASLPVLDMGEPGFATDTKRLYVGNGILNTLYYPSTEVPLTIVPATLPSGTTTVKVGINSAIDTSNGATTTPVDLRCSILSPATDRVGTASTLFGYQTKATGASSIAMGNNTTATGDYSFASGRGTTAETYGLTVIGYYDAVSTGSAVSPSSTQNAFIIGNGTSSVRSNCFRVRYDGNVFGLAAFNSVGADYAEYFEWEDGNVDHDDRIGRFVYISSDDKISIGNNTPKEDILGVVSGAPAIKGNTASSNWHGMYNKDDFGRTQYTTSTSADGKEVASPVINPAYNSQETYIPREFRQEWDAIGFLGRLRVIDDGSCIVGQKCGCGPNGEAVNATSGFKVLKRISANVVEILIK